MAHPVAVLANLAICLFVAALPAPAWSVPPPAAASVRELVPHGSWEKQFKITEGKDRGKIVPLTAKPDAASEKRWKLIFGSYAAIHLIRQTGGAVMIERLDLLKSRNSIVYETALPVAPDNIDASDLIRQQTGYKMYSIETGKLKRAGRIAHKVKPPLPAHFDTPAGRLPGYYVEIDHQMDMEYYSQLHLTVGLGFQLDEGPVYGSAQYTLTKLGLFTESKAAGAALFTR